MNINYLSNGFRVIDDKIRFSIPKKLKEHLNDKYQINDNFFYIKLKTHVLLCLIFSIGFPTYSIAKK